MISDLFSDLKDPNPDVRVRAIRKLKDQGHAIRNHMKLIADSLADPDLTVRGVAVAILSQSQFDCLPLLVQGLDDPRLRAGALAALGNLGPAAQGALPALKECLTSSDILLRTGVLQILRNIGLEHPWVIEAFETSLGDPADTIRSLAASTLNRIAERTPELIERSIPALIAALDDKRPDVRVKVLGALGHLGPAASTAIPALDQLRIQHGTSPELESTLEKITTMAP